VRAFKGIFCDDISEFESYMPSHAVGSLTDTIRAGLCKWLGGVVGKVSVFDRIRDCAACACFL
jgi:hypothetical protein